MVNTAKKTFSISFVRTKPMPRKNTTVAIVIDEFPCKLCIPKVQATGKQHIVFHYAHSHPYPKTYDVDSENFGFSSDDSNSR